MCIRDRICGNHVSSLAGDTFNMPACGKRSKAFSETLGSDGVLWSSVLRWPACLREPRFDLSTIAHFGVGGNTVDVAHARIFVASHLLQHVAEVAACNGRGRCEPG